MIELRRVDLSVTRAPAASTDRLDVAMLIRVRLEWPHHAPNFRSGVYMVSIFRNRGVAKKRVTH